MATYTAQESSKPKGESVFWVECLIGHSRVSLLDTRLTDYCRATGKVKKIAEPCKRFTLTGTLFLIPWCLK